MTAETVAASEPPPEVATAPEPPPEQIVLALNALGMLWSTFQLYPDARTQPAFVRALEELRSGAFYPFELDVGPGVLGWRRQEIHVEREGVERFAKALFLHDIAAIEFEAPPTADEVVACFKVAAIAPSEMASYGGARAALASQGVESIQLFPRMLLVEPAGSDSEDHPTRDAELEALLAMVDEPEALATQLLDLAAGDPAELARLFLTHYLSLCGRVSEDDYGAHESVVRFFVESVFCLPAEMRPTVLGLLLSEKDDVRVQTLLDQFSGHDLADLSAGLDPESVDRLFEYARLATEGTGSRPEDVLALLQPAGVVEEARRAVAERVEKLLAGPQALGVMSDAFENLRAQIPTELSSLELSTELLRRIIAAEEREVRFRRILRIWTGRVARNIRSGALSVAGSWLRAVLDDPLYPPEWEGQVKQALVDLASPTLLDSLVAHLADDGDTAPVDQLLRAWGPSVTGRLVEQLSDEENPARRRVLMDFLVVVGKMDPAPLLPFLADKRWFVVRNLIAILGRTGRKETGHRILLLVDHSDFRVRVEALRALVPILGDDATEPILEALVDPHERVRQAALLLLRASTDHRVDAGLMEALRSNRLGAAERERLAAVLNERGTESGREVLERHAGRRVALTAAQRKNREAARAVLRKGEG